MKFTFDYEETLTRRIVVDADDLAKAIQELHRRLDDEEIVLGAEDFAGAEIRMPLYENRLPRLECFGCEEKVEGLDIVVDYW